MYSSAQLATSDMTMHSLWTPVDLNFDPQNQISDCKPASSLTVANNISFLLRNHLKPNTGVVVIFRRLKKTWRQKKTYQLDEMKLDGPKWTVWRKPIELEVGVWFVSNINSRSADLRQWNIDLSPDTDNKETNQERCNWLATVNCTTPLFRKWDIDYHVIIYTQH